MAKISRRVVVASSSLNSAAINLPSSISFASSSSGSSTLSSSTTSSSASAAAGTISNQSVTPLKRTISSESRRANVNRIVNERKSTRSVPSSSSSSSGTSNFIGNPLDGYASASATVTAMPYPLRNDGTQYTTTTAHSNVYAYTTTTGPNKNMPYTASPLPPDRFNKTLQEHLYQQERDRIRREFFETYDVMTGVRIAATLGGFFGLMVFLIVWKSRSSSNETLKVLKDPKMAAVAAVCMQEEEEREIQEAMVATGMSIYPDEYDAILYRRQRMLSLGNVSAPPMLNRGFRFSSVGGGYSSLLEPPRRFSFSAASGALSIGGGSYAGSRRRSGSETSRIFSNYPMGSSFGTDDYFVETDDELENGDYQQRETTVQMEHVGKRYKRTDSVRSKQGFLEVPLAGQDSRRSSAMTCCSTDSSYLERRCSAFTLGLSNLPPSLQRKCSTASRASSIDTWDYYYPDIQVIQPTPKPSPCPSERSIYEQLQVQSQPLAQPQTQASKTTTTTIEMETSLRGLATVTTTSKPASKPKKSLTNIATTATTTTNNSGLASFKGGSSAVAATTSSNQFIRKHSIAFYDPESAQSGRKQQIHSISADTVDVYPYNQSLTERGIYDSSKPAQSAPPAGVHHGFRFSDSPAEELRLNAKHKIAVVELPRIPYPEQDTPPGLVALAYENNNIFPYSNSAAAKAAANAANSSSISIDSTPLSIDKLNGSGSLGTIFAKALFNAEKRAPLASLSSFKISSLEYQDSELRSMDEDSVFLDSVANTDEDMQQMSSDSEEASFPEDLNVQTMESLVPAKDQKDNALSSITASTSTRYPLEKRFSLEVCSTAPMTTGILHLAGSTSGMPITASARVRRSLLQRHRTLSVSSSDRVTLLGQPLKDFSSSSAQTTSLDTKQQTPLETHFGAIICTNSPPAHPRRAQLLQQYSDPQSMPTTTTTTTNTTEEDTCSTLNTEVGLGLENVAEVCEAIRIGSTETVAMGSTTRGSTSLTQHSSLNTVVSFGRSSPCADSQHSQHQSPHQHTHSPQQILPISTTSTQYDPCASSISDSFLQHATKESLIKMPSSLKSLILQHKSTASTTQEQFQKKPQQQEQQHTDIPITISRSATNLTYTDSIPRTHVDYLAYDSQQRSPCPSVTVALPLIRLPTDESSSADNSQRSEYNIGTAAAVDDEHSHSCGSDQPSDPSLPGSSRKWSKETLF